MKQIILAASVLSLSLSSCTQTIILDPSNPEMMARYGYVKAQPVQAAQPKVYANNPDAAFDQQVQAYSAEKAATQPTQTLIPPPQVSNTQPNLNVADIVAPIVTNPVTSALVTNLNDTQAPEQQYTQPTIPAAVTQEPSFIQPTQPAQNQNVGVMDYSIKITNGTPNRLFIEAQDANGAIYPCGFMQPGQSETTKLEQVQPVAGPVLVVVRDPDQPGAPELRRYRIATPNMSYAGKTLGFTVIPKGRYEASIDGQPYYKSESDD